MLIKYWHVKGVVDIDKTPWNIYWDRCSIK